MKFSGFVSVTDVLIPCASAQGKDSKEDEGCGGAYIRRVRHVYMRTKRVGLFCISSTVYVLL